MLSFVDGRRCLNQQIKKIAVSQLEIGLAIE